MKGQIGNLVDLVNGTSSLSSAQQGPWNLRAPQTVHQQVCVAVLSELGLWVLKFYLHTLSPCHKALCFPLPGLCNCGNVNCRDQS